jgi:hypothetical protein
VDYPAGICLFKIIVRESHLDSNATTMSIRTDLSNLDEWVHKNGSDITEVNAHVRHLLDGLAARGETTHDLTVNLFKAYEVVQDKEFMHYIRSLRNGHQDGTAVITDATLMNQAANYYKNRKQLGLWEEPSDEMKQIYALETKLRKALNGKKSNTTGSQSKKSSKRSPARPVKPDWLVKHIPPKEGDMNKPREWGGRKWWYCDEKTGGKCPGMWRCSHKPSACKHDDITAAKRKAKAEKADKPKDEAESDKKKKKKKGLAVRMAEATQAVTTQESEDMEE